MADTITVASRAHLALRIAEPMPEEFKDHPGDAPMLRSAVINGSNHPEAVNGVGLTPGVDAEMFGLWLDAQKKGNTALADLVSDHRDDEEMPAMEFGHEPGLARLAENADNVALTEKGSTVTHEGPATADDMSATSDTPNDDTPRGDPDVVPVVRSQTPATAEVAPATEEHHEG